MAEHLADNVADMVARLDFLERKSKHDDETLNLLMRQKDTLAAELANHSRDSSATIYTLQQDHAKVLDTLQKERDAAIQQAKEARAVVETLAKMAIEGMRRMLPTETAKGPPAAPAAASAAPMHLRATAPAPGQKADPRLPAATLDGPIDPPPLFLQQRG